jgi:hypothetical protein
MLSPIGNKVMLDEADDVSWKDCDDLSKLSLDETAFKSMKFAPGTRVATNNGPPIIAPRPVFRAHVPGIMPYIIEDLFIHTPVSIQTAG